MPDLLLELRSEEIPARMQRKAAGDLRKMVTDGLVEAGLTYEAAREYWTPRRLALDIRGLTARSKDARDEIKGPPVKAPDAAIQGFLRKAGLMDVSQAHVHTDPKKGDFYVAHIVKPGRAAEDIIAALIPQAVRGFPWPKSMRWGAASGPKGVRYGTVTGVGGEALRWVRPLQSIVCTFGPETEEPVVVDFEIDGIASGNITYGHRFHSPGAISVRRFDDYAAKLEAGKVVIDADRRKEIILSDARNLAFANGLDLVEDEALLEEVSGLVEWPVVLMGEFEADFLEIPAEVIRLTIRANQKCFVTRDSSLPVPGRVGAAGVGVGSSQNPAFSDESTVEPGTGDPTRPLRGQPPQDGEGSLSNRFILTANIEAKDGGREIAHGNGKVVRARLSDALYFWKTDQADLPDLDQLQASAEKFELKRDTDGKLLPLDQRMARLDHLGVTFHAKLGTQGERVQRIARLAEELAPMVARSLPPRGRVAAQRPGGVSQGSAGGQGASSAAEATPTAAFGGTSPSRGKGTAQLARRAAILAKADLTTEIVGEFPELQGLIGRKYALLQGEHPSVAAAIEEHYKPQGPSDRVPTDPVSIAVALADKLDTLVGFWAIDEKPTGSKDPFALRRAALGVVRILVDEETNLILSDQIIDAFSGIIHQAKRAGELHCFDDSIGRIVTFGPNDELRIEKDIVYSRDRFSRNSFMFAKMIDAEIWKRLKKYKKLDEILVDLLSFFHDRLKVYLRDKGARHDLIDAVLAGGGSAPVISPPVGEMSPKATEGGAVPQTSQPSDEKMRSTLPPSGLPPISPTGGEISQSQNDDLLAIVRRVEALGTFLDTEDGKNLLAGTKRAANILAAEEKKGTAIADTVDPGLFNADAEKALFAAVNQAESDAAQAIQNEDYSAAMRALSELRALVDSFFEDVHVNDEDAAVRANRLALLARIRAATGAVADFSRIAG